ncbi:hypothetical protein QR680_008223 [Steinernema hermaphroditum]|uniref:Peptidase M16 N-terminal domain-containing protein n=1 Tax=Steinernema hermaphroditum TaxID=289476 RepID=A0AA39M7A0_9BILA|nr:hypothetical protein QR680_008223 [Steinernema hermaphroditum]
MSCGNVVKKRYDNLKKSTKDAKEYRGLELANGMRILLISDPSATKCGAAMTVAAGASSEPEELPGMAHFCEHMLFRGTNKYPVENDFKRFISQNRGYSNGSTSTFRTSYYFDIAPKHFKKALDRFIHFFISPLFTESALEREVQAVDSEFKNVQQSDTSRIWELAASFLLTPDTMMYFVMAKENAHLEELQKEKYFGTEFKKSKLSEELIRRFEKALVTPVEGLGLPDLKYDKIATKKMIRPKKMEENEYFRLWHVENAKYNNGMNVLLTVPSMLGDQVKQICTRTLVECFQVRLFDESLEIIEIQYGEMEEPQKLRVKFHSRGFELCFSYIDSICDEFASFMEKIVDYTPGETAFNVTLKEVVKNLKNFEANQPYDQSKHLLSTVLTEGGCTPFELLEAAQTVTYAKFLEFIPQMWNALHLELLVYGNVAKEQVHQLASRLSNVFMEKNASIRALSPQELGPFVHLQIPAGNTLRCDHEQRIHPNSCTDVYLQIGSLDIRDTLLLDLVVKLISEPAFDALRTKEQLGYYVKALTHRSDGGQGLRCVVQGGHDPNYVEERIDVFLENFQKIIRSLSDGEFYRTRSLVSREVRSAPSGSRLVEPCWKEIKNGQCRFHFEKVAMKGEKELKKLTKEDLIEFYGTKIAPGAEQRRKLSVRLYSTQRANEAKNIGEEKATNVDSLMERLIIQ